MGTKATIEEHHYGEVSVFLYKREDHGHIGVRLSLPDEDLQGRNFLPTVWVKEASGDSQADTSALYVVRSSGSGENVIQVPITVATEREGAELLRKVAAVLG